jgi:fucose permease
VLGAFAVNYAGVAVMFVATTNPVFFVGKLLNGIVGGALVSVMIGYISEVHGIPDPMLFS